MTKREIEILVEGGRRLSKIFAEILAKIKPGVRGEKIDQLARKLINKMGGQPSFAMVPGYHWAICLNINQGVVHGVPTGVKIKEGDLVSLDMGMFYRGLHTDMAYTFFVGKPPLAIKRFLKAGKNALKKGIAWAKPGNTVGDISKTIEAQLKKAGYFPVKEFSGHGIGRKLHQEVLIPCWTARKITKQLRFQLYRGQGLAVEVIYKATPAGLKLLDDGWTIETQDGKIAGLFEQTVVVEEGQPLVVTPFVWEDGGGQKAKS